MFCRKEGSGDPGGATETATKPLSIWGRARPITDTSTASRWEDRWGLPGGSSLQPGSWRVHGRPQVAMGRGPTTGPFVPELRRAGDLLQRPDLCFLAPQSLSLSVRQRMLRVPRVHSSGDGIAGHLPPHTQVFFPSSPPGLCSGLERQFCPGVVNRGGRVSSYWASSSSE